MVQIVEENKQYRDGESRPRRRPWSFCLPDQGRPLIFRRGSPLLTRRLGRRTSLREWRQFAALLRVRGKRT